MSTERRLVPDLASEHTQKCVSADAQMHKKAEQAPPFFRS